MKPISSPDKAKLESVPRLEKDQANGGELFLGYKALHELRILMRIASSGSHFPSKDDEKRSF